MSETVGLRSLPRERALERAERLAARFAADAARHDEMGALASEVFATLHAENLIGLTAPTALGGSGAGLAEAVAVIRTLAKGEPSAALILFMQYVNLATLPEGRWDPAQVSRVIRDATADGALINSLRVEPELGSPSRGGLPTTTAVRTATGWEISGRKIYSTGSTHLAFMLVWARTDEDPLRVGRFLLPAATPGITVEPTWNAIGMRASASHDVVFDRVAVPHAAAADVRPPAEWKGREPLQAAWHAALLSAVYDGIAHAARDWVLHFLRTRAPSNLGTPLATLRRVQQEVGQIEALLLVNAGLIDALAHAVDRGDPPAPEAAALAKVAATENAIAVVDRCLRLSANHGISRSNPLERHHRDVLCGRIHTPQDDAAYVGAGRKALETHSEHAS